MLCDVTDMKCYDPRDYGSRSHIESRKTFTLHRTPSSFALPYLTHFGGHKDTGSTTAKRWYR